MFPSVGRSQIQHLLADMSAESVIEVLLCKKVRQKKLSALLQEQQEKVISTDSHSLVMTRSCIINKAKVYYKGCIHQPSQLKRSLLIQFMGEEGVDGGALKNDFFTAYLRHIQEELFEGQANQLVPRSHWGSDCEFEMAGAAIAHSLLLGGPGFPSSCLFLPSSCF